MKLKHILTKPALIEYRTKLNGEDIFAGECKYTNDGKLLSIDGDSYSLDDEIIHYEISELPYDQQIITVWYESE